MDEQSVDVPNEEPTPVPVPYEPPVAEAIEGPDPGAVAPGASA